MVNNDITMGIMLMDMVMVIERQRTGLGRTEQLQERGIVAHMLGVSGTADVMVKADYVIR